MGIRINGGQELYFIEHIRRGSWVCFYVYRSSFTQCNCTVPFTEMFPEAF